MDLSQGQGSTKVGPHEANYSVPGKPPALQLHVWPLCLAMHRCVLQETVKRVQMGPMPSQCPLVTYHLWAACPQTRKGGEAPVVPGFAPHASSH